MTDIEIDAYKEGFTWLVLQRIDPNHNAYRYYAIGWQETILGWAVVRFYGRLGNTKRTLPPLLFGSLDEAWPVIRSLLRKRLKRGYQVVIDMADVGPVWPQIVSSAN